MKINPIMLLVTIMTMLGCGSEKESEGKKEDAIKRYWSSEVSRVKESYTLDRSDEVNISMLHVYSFSPSDHGIKEAEVESYINIVKESRGRLPSSSISEEISGLMLTSFELKSLCTIAKRCLQDYFDFAETEVAASLTCTENKNECFDTTYQKLREKLIETRKNCPQ